MNKVICISNGPNMSFTPYMSKMAELLNSIGVEVELFTWAREYDEVNSIDPPNITIKMLMRRGKFKCNRFVLVSLYFLWMFKVFFKVIFSEENKIICSRFEAAFPVYLVSLFKNIDYMYCDRDNLHSTYKWGKFMYSLVFFIEKKIANKAKIHLIPGQSRDYTSAENVRVVPNKPTNGILNSAKKMSLSKKYNFLNGKRTIYINGWISETRGLHSIINLLSSNLRNDINVIIAGIIPDEIQDRVDKLENVYYLGHLSSIESLSYYFHSDLVISLYDPNITINVNAEPNKWWDCVVTNTAFITNFGVETVSNFNGLVRYFQIDYENEASLSEFISNFDFESELPKLSVNIPLWEDEMEDVIYCLIGNK